MCRNTRHLDLSEPAVLTGCTGSDKTPSMGLADKADLKPVTLRQRKQQ